MSSDECVYRARKAVASFSSWHTRLRACQRARLAAESETAKDHDAIAFMKKVTVTVSSDENALSALVTGERQLLPQFFCKTNAVVLGAVLLLSRS